MLTYLRSSSKNNTLLLDRGQHRQPWVWGIFLSPMHHPRQVYIYCMISIFEPRVIRSIKSEHWSLWISRGEDNRHLLSSLGNFESKDAIILSCMFPISSNLLRFYRIVFSSLPPLRRARADEMVDRTIYLIPHSLLSPNILACRDWIMAAFCVVCIPSSSLCTGNNFSNCSSNCEMAVLFMLHRIELLRPVEREGS